jgi:hypothetical protein
MRFVEAPATGVWRVARAPDPLALSAPLPPDETDGATTGNRFDAPRGTYGVRYFSSTLDGCFGETLARFRPSPALLTALDGDWEERFLRPGEVPADWRYRRLAVRVQPQPEISGAIGGRFLDVEALASRQRLRAELANLLAYYELDDLDIATVRGRDRRITRWISQWAYDQGLAGIRYLSRLNDDWECWAVFDHVLIEEQERLSILREDQALSRVAKLFGLRVF